MQANSAVRWDNIIYLTISIIRYTYMFGKMACFPSTTCKANAIFNIAILRLFRFTKLSSLHRPINTTKKIDTNNYTRQDSKKIFTSGKHGKHKNNFFCFLFRVLSCIPLAEKKSCFSDSLRNVKINCIKWRLWYYQKGNWYILLLTRSTKFVRNVNCIKWYYQNGNWHIFSLVLW